MKNNLSLFFLGIGLLFSINLKGQTRELIEPIEPIEPCEPAYEMRWYYDSDGDGFGNPFIWRDECTPPYKYVSNNKDCDDNNATITTAKWWYPDNDGDGLGGKLGQKSCTVPVGNWVSNNDDCDDTNAQILGALAWYKDLDKDGEGGISSTPTYSCTDPSNSTYSYVLTKKDCDDNDPQVQQITWYLDEDGDGFGDPDVFKIQCSKPIGDYVSNSSDLCPNIAGFRDGCPPAGIDVVELWNTVQTSSFDREGTLRSKSKSYFDDLGRAVQSQSLDIKSRKVWANHNLYDSFGRLSLSTLSAPTNMDIPGDFLYREDFVKKADNSTFQLSDYENSGIDPSTVGNQENSLGWYYSTTNTSEPYQDVTDRPYFKTEYSTLNPGQSLRSIGGNKKEGNWKTSYSFSMSVGQELSQADAFNDILYNSMKSIKTVIRDIHGNENVVFMDAEGKTIATAKSGGGVARTMTVKIPLQGYIDIHIPSGSNAIGISISKPTGREVEIYDLISESVVTTSPSSLGNGFYRISIVNTEFYNPALLPVNVSYKENYYDYALNKYDKAGRLIESFQPLDKLKTEFSYNALGQLVYTKSPDEGEAWFKYRKDGQIRYSQNSKQKASGEFSYTEYDQQARPVESGVLKNINFSTSDPDAILPAGIRIEQQFSVYDDLIGTDLNYLSSVHSSYSSPTFLAGNVAKTSNANVTSYYSYDIFGRLKWMVQNINGLGPKTIDYTYDNITGEVTLVDYQKHTPGERFLQKYSYDIKGQLTQVETSTDAVNYSIQARYEYYEGGSLKRKVIGDNLQGMDYVYNLEGSLKSINHPDLISSKDPGGDSNDLFGMTLHYNSNDYNRFNTPKPISVSSLGDDQYNGNIKGIEWKTNGMSQANYYYGYNRNNWLTRADYNLGTGTTDYRVDNLAYDANGNILTLRRNKHYENGTNVMDNLTYRYKAGTNQLTHVDDAVTVNTNANDIKDQASGNYVYNSIGQLILNAQDGITYTYLTSGLISKVESAESSVSFYYDDRGQRSKKISSNGTITNTTFYVRDASGNPLAIYNGNSLEHPVYGISRLGVVKRTVGQSSLAQENYFYELTDHLGNVRAVVNKNSVGNVVALVKTDYYPFGMPMPNRNTQSDYRYAYQGQEKDSETEKEAFELRLWDARIGRWLTTDPYRQFNSPYLGMGNNPISMIDPDGGYCYDANGNQVPCADISSQTGFDLSMYEGPTVESFNMLPEVVLTGSGGNGVGNIAAKDATGWLSLAGGMGVDIYNSTIPNMTKDNFLIGRIDPKYAIDFSNNTPNTAMGNIYEKGYKESLKSIDNLKAATKIGGKLFNTLSYYETAEDAFEGNYNDAAANGVQATGSLLSNYVPILGPLVYEGTWAIGDNYLIKQKWYNRAVFGVHSRVYRERGLKFGYIKY